MKTIVRLKNISLKNIKNIKSGVITTNSLFTSMQKADVIGIYGSNGSGKTTVIEACNLLKTLLSCSRLPQNSEYLLQSGQNEMELAFCFLINNKFGEYTVNYTSTLIQNKDKENPENNRLQVIKENISYKENIFRKQYKMIVEKNLNKILIRNKSPETLENKYQIKILLADDKSAHYQQSFIFAQELQETYAFLLTEIEQEILINIQQDFNRNLFIINDRDNGLVLSNLVMPFNIFTQQAHGNLPLNINGSMVLHTKLYHAIEKAINQINRVIDTLVPHLHIEIKNIAQETLENGEEGIRFELLSERNNIKLPLKCESAGVIKLISILSSLIAVNNNPNACVLIDELDSGIFEYLLGNIISSINENGKGQLLFTSHNLRALEVLNSKNIWFTTTNNKNRFIQIKGSKRNSNIRDMYIRAVQLGGQTEDLYEEASAYKMKKGFSKAGEIND